MDLLDFSDTKLYFEEALPIEIEQLIAAAAQNYGDPTAELQLLRAHLLAPEHLTVIVALYRYYFYQHRLNDVLTVADHAMRIAARHLGLPSDWRKIEDAHLGSAAKTSFGLLRFYLLALKAESIVLLRLGRINESRERLHKLTSLDQRDHLGAAKLLDVVDEFQSEQSAPTPESLSFAIA